MRRLVILAFATTSLLLAACPSKPKNGECKSSADCAAQQGVGTVCVTGRCVECAADSDCTSGFACQKNRCEPKAGALGAADTSGQRDGAGAGSSGAADAACGDPTAFTVRFGFDQSSLAGDATATLQKLAGCLQRSPAKKVGVDGHCDDRGTTVYNMALGKKRAEAVAKYLRDLGVSAPAETNTYGKERPVCREATEDCWARNRRAELQIGR
jgi:peptidoglycan-associated lipoprotein